jgi:bifunctional non-homologous end joining protein LigD
MELAEYRRKRSFALTPEPRGRVKTQAARKQLSFVVQKHDASRLHYDFRLELDGVLKSWAVPKGPSMNPNDKRLAMLVEDHPLSYATFEGEIPRGQYGAGSVIVWDRGKYVSRETANPEESRKKIKNGLLRGELKIVLLGKKLRGGFVLVKLNSAESNAWLLIKERDEYATTDDVTKQARSVISKSVLPRDAKRHG